MTEKWEGFTAEEISNIANQKYSLNKDSIQSSSHVKKMTFKQNKLSKKNMTRERMLKNSNKYGAGESQAVLPQEARLFIQQIPEEDEIEDTTSNNENTSINNIELTPLPPGLINIPENTQNSTTKTYPSPSDGLLSAPNDASLDEFEKRQKMIKEQNRQRKELLKKALEDRTKKTHEEARRLSQIEEELKRLDIQLSNDVSILRNQIEVASLEFMEAQKRFDRAEREYLDAKLALFTKKERKELLTAHLCTIIEQNELRKAKKLSDLMDKLHLGALIIEKPMEKPTEIRDIKSDEEKVIRATESPVST